MNFKQNPAQASANQAPTATDLIAEMASLPGWQATPAALDKQWRVPDFGQAMQLANALAALAERIHHHPELRIGWGRVGVRWTTHDAGGVTARDVQAARETDRIAAQLGAVAVPAAAP